MHSLIQQKAKEKRKETKKTQCGSFNEKKNFSKNRKRKEMKRRKKKKN